MRRTSTGRAAPPVVRPAGDPDHHSSGGSRRRSVIGHRSVGAAVAVALTVALTLRPVGCSVESASERLQISETSTMTNSNYTTDRATTSETEPAADAHTSNLSAAGGSQSPLASDGESVKFPLYMRLIATFVCLIIFTVGVCGNLLVPLVVIKTKYLRNSTNLFLINLSIADLLVLIFCMPTMLIELHSRPETWLLGETMCKLGNFIEMLAANSSIFTILAISFERYYAICKPLKAGYKCTRLRASIIIGIIWLLSCVLTSPILNMAKSDETIYIDGSVVRNCILETATYWNRMYVFVSMIAFFCLPLLVLMLVYWLIGRRLIRENVSMMDATRDNLIDNRAHRRQPNDINDTSISSGSYVSSVFRKRFAARSRRSFRTLFKLSYLNGDGHAMPHNRGSANGQSKSIDFGSDTNRAGPICMARNRSAKTPVINHSSSPNGVKRVDLESAHTLSLDNHGNYRRNLCDQPNRSPRRTIQSLARGQSESQSFWSSIVTQTDNDIRAQPPSVETTATTATTSSSLISRDTTNVEVAHVQVSFLSKLRSNLRFLINLFGGANPPSKSTAVSNEVDSATIHTNSLLGGSIKSKLKDERKNQTDGSTATDLRKAQLSYENKQIDQGHGLTNGSNYDSTKKSDEKAVGGERIYQPTLNDAEWISVDDHEQYSSKREDMTTDAAFVAINRRSFGATGPKRLSSSLKCSGDNSGTPPMKSKFKWMKGVSISSTGSTRTNSTCLASEAGSVHCRNQNSPSPPRSLQQQQQQHRSKNNTRELKCEQNISSFTRDTSSEKLVPVIEQRETSPDGIEGRLARVKSRPTDATAVRLTRRTMMDSRSSSTTYNEAEISSYSDGSSSPSCSIAADFTSTRSWIESVSLQDQKNINDPNQLQSQQRRLGQHEGDQQFMDDWAKTTTKLESVHELSSIYLETEDGAQVLEVVVDEDENNMNDDDEKPDEHLVSDWRAHSKVEAAISFSDAGPATNINHDDGVNALGYRHDLDLITPDHIGDLNYDLIVSESPGQFGKANLVTNCPNGIENLRQDVAGKRSGSHPVVSCRKLAKLADGPVEVHCLQPEFIAVRDISKKQQMDSRRQVVAMLAFVVACFFLLFFPYRVFTIWLIMSTEDQVQSLGMETYYNITYFSRILIYLHSAINPIAYNLISTKFRRAFTSILLCRGASTRRNFNVDHLRVNKSKNQANYPARPRVADCSSNKSPTALKAPA